jgi:hypothetical protein
VAIYGGIQGDNSAAFLEENKKSRMIVGFSAVCMVFIAAVTILSGFIVAAIMYETLPARRRTALAQDFSLSKSVTNN